MITWFDEDTNKDRTEGEDKGVYRRALDIKFATIENDMLETYGVYLELNPCVVRGEE